MSDHDWHRPMEDNPYCDEQLLSLPTMYQWTCSKCGAVAYRDCNEGEPPRDGCTSKSANDEVSNLVDRYEKRIAELESLVRDMQALDRMHHGPFSWERIDKVQDMRGSINARLIKMGFVEEVGE